MTFFAFVVGEANAMLWWYSILQICNLYNIYYAVNTDIMKYYLVIIILISLAYILILKTFIIQSV